MRRLSLTARQALDAPVSDVVEVVLIKISHPALDAPVRLSSDPTERLSIEPLAYGTRSTWGGAGADDPYQFALMETELPEDADDTPAAMTIYLANVAADMAAPLRSTTVRATVDIAVVLAASPDLVEYELTGLRLLSAEIDATAIKLSISHQPIVAEPFPGRRMTKAAFPTLWR